MPNPNLYESGDEMGQETVHVESPLVGSFTAVLGKTYKFAGKSRTGIILDFFLLNRSPADDPTNNVKMMEVITKGGKSVLSFLNGKDGKPQYSGRMFSHRLIDSLAKDSDAARNFFASERRAIARIFKAFDEVSSQIDWKRVQSSAGRFITFNIIQRGEYINIETKSLQLMESGQVSIENLAELYKIIETEKMKKKLIESGASADAPTPPSDSDLPF